MEDQSILLAIVQKIAVIATKPQIFISIVGVALNLFHLFILTRQSMRFNATNVILIGIAVSDLFFLSYYVKGGVGDLLNSGLDSECIPPKNYLDTLFYWIISVLRDVFRRVSAWLGVFLALQRALVIKFAGNRNLAFLLRTSTSWKVIFCSLVVSGVVSSLNWAKLEIIQYVHWIPPEHCDYPANSTFVRFELNQARWLRGYTIQMFQTFLFIDGCLKLAPPVLYPFLAAVLIFEWRKARKRRQELGGGEERDRVTMLVIYMTVIYFLSETPIGLSYWLQLWYFDDIDALWLINSFTVICTTLLLTSSSVHCFVCFSLTSQYRRVVGATLGCDERRASAT